MSSAETGKQAAGSAASRRGIALSGLLDWLLIAVVLLYAAVLVVGPMLAILTGAFASGVGEFLRQLRSTDLLYALGLTLTLGIATTVLNTVFGVCLAMVLVRDNFRGRALLNGIVDLPMAVSPVIAGFMLILLFGREGWLAGVLDALGVKVVFALPGMLLATTFVSLPFVAREVMPVLIQAGTRQEDAARTMGASSWQTFWFVTLRSIRWGLLYGVSLTFARALGEFGAVLVVSGGVSGMTETATLFIFRSLDDRNMVGACAAALVLALFSLFVLGWMEYFKKKTPVH